MKKAKKILKTTIKIILSLIILINIILVIKSEINKNKIPDFLGFTPFISKNDGKLIITKRTPIDKLKIGDVISYNENGNIIINRITEIIGQDKQKLFKTKNDDSNIENKILVSENNIYGKCLLKIPVMGKLYTYASTSAGMLLVIAIIIIIYIIFEIINQIFYPNKTVKLKNITNQMAILVTLFAISIIILIGTFSKYTIEEKTNEMEMKNFEWNINIAETTSTNTYENDIILTKKESEDKQGTFDIVANNNCDVDVYVSDLNFQIEKNTEDLPVQFSITGTDSENCVWLNSIDELNNAIKEEIQDNSVVIYKGGSENIIFTIDWKINSDKEIKGKEYILKMNLKVNKIEE